MLFCCCGFYFDGTVNHIGPECNVLPAFKYGEGFDWFCFNYGGVWCSSLTISFIWPLLNEVLCVDVIECRILARSFWNLTLGLSVTYHMALGKSLNLSVFLYLSGVKNTVLIISLGDWWCMSSQPCFGDAVLCDRALLLHLCFSGKLTKLICSVVVCLVLWVFFLMCSYIN